MIRFMNQISYQVATPYPGNYHNKFLEYQRAVNRAVA